MNKHLIIAIYVDDIVIACKELDRIVDFKKRLGNRFKTKDLGEVNYVLKIRVERMLDGGWKIHQHNYIDDLIKFYDLRNDKRVSIPIKPNHKLTVDLEDEKDHLRADADSTEYRQVIGKLMYLMKCSRPDICYAVCVLSRFMSAPKEKHWRYVKQLLRYIKTTRDYELVYPVSESINLTGYTDSDHAGDLGDRKSTGGFAFILSGCTISWRSMKQKTIAISSTEAENVAMSEATTEAIWLKAILSELSIDIGTITMCNDNQSSMHIIRNPSSHNRSKHIDVRFHFIRDHYQNGTISLKYIESEKLCADFLTKGVHQVKHAQCMKQLNILN